MIMARSTPDLSVPKTQDTAPVYEFQCLWTQDLRKKQKKWHDGSLKYHTFNKRLMVWDDRKNYVGDAHWTSSVDLQEGDELSLDRGALVEVGERIGSTVTDLAPLRETVRQHPVRSDASPRLPSREPLPRSTFQSTGNRSQWQPKPLSAILGNSQGPIGRARLPSKSPFDQRQQQMPRTIPYDSRPTKRLRMSPEQENGQQTNNIDAAAEAVVATVPTALTVNRDKNLAMKQLSRIQPEATGPALGEESTNLQRSATGFAQKSQVAAATSKPTVSLRAPSKPSNAQPVVSRADTTSAFRPPPSRLATGHSAGRQSSKPMPADSGRTRLRFQKCQPRQKLMYQDLLPSREKKNGNEAFLKGRQIFAANAKQISRERRRRDSSTMFDELVIPEDFDSMPSPPVLPVQTVVRHGTTSATPISVSSSPEKVSYPCSEASEDGLDFREQENLQDVGDNHPPEDLNGHQTNGTSLDEIHLSLGQGDEEILLADIPSSPLFFPSQGHYRQRGRAGAEKDAEVVDVAATPPPQSPPSLHMTSPISSRLALLDQQIFSKQSQRLDQPPPTVQQVSLSKSLDKDPPENDSHQENEAQHEHHSPATPPRPSPKRASPAKQQGRTTSGVFKSPRKMPKSKSLSEIIQQTSVKKAAISNPASVVEETDDSEKGPWTTHEAWDLFDWWPKDGREKPNFGEVLRQDKGEVNSLGEQLAGFISAIDVL